MSVKNNEPFHFALPPTLGPEAGARGPMLEQTLEKSLGRPAKVVIPATYELLARELLSGKVDAAWAPPFVCARVEAMGVRVLARGVRRGASTYRAAVVCRNDAALKLETLRGTVAAWSDPDSVGGYLLAAAYLREKGVDLGKTFSRQEFLGSYRAALLAVHEGRADVASVFAPSPRGGDESLTGLGELWPEQASSFRVVTFTHEAPNDGVAVSMTLAPAAVTELERMLLSLHQAAAGQDVLVRCFRAERFEPAPRMGYRALYRVALASL